MTQTDIKGLAVSTSSSEALAAYERGLDLFLRWRGGPMEALGAAVKADPGFVLAHCARALIAWRMGQVAAAWSAHRDVMALADRVHDERERAHVEVVDAPNHLQSLAALAWAYGRTGQVAEQRQAWSQFIRKAEAVGLAPDAPALALARRALHATA